MADYEDNPANDPDVNKELGEWLDENPWFNSDPVLREAAIEMDVKLHMDGIPVGKTRFRHVEDKLRSAYPERFYDVPDRKPKWSDIRDPNERRAAKASFEKLEQASRISGRKVKSEEEYLRDYFGD